MSKLLNKNLVINCSDSLKSNYSSHLRKVLFSFASSDLVNVSSYARFFVRKKLSGFRQGVAMFLNVLSNRALNVFKRFLKHLYLNIYIVSCMLIFQRALKRLEGQILAYNFLCHFIPFFENTNTSSSFPKSRGLPILQGLGKYARQ